MNLKVDVIPVQRLSFVSAARRFSSCSWVASSTWHVQQSAFVISLIRSTNTLQYSCTCTIVRVLYTYESTKYFSIILYFRTKVSCYLFSKVQYGNRYFRKYTYVYSTRTCTELYEKITFESTKVRVRCTSGSTFVRKYESTTLYFRTPYNVYFIYVYSFTPLLYNVVTYESTFEGTKVLPEVLPEVLYTYTYTYSLQRYQFAI